MDELGKKLEALGFVRDDSWKSNTSGYNKPVYRYEYESGDVAIVYSLGGYTWLQYRPYGSSKNINKSFETPEELLAFME